ncbi:hypothetical protein HDV05_004963 [Chytridiales sp. JEL 0842]|nr:hypothetical protein HDV05_004963 [Chytridiales sp. JEL 0842]
MSSQQISFSSLADLMESNETYWRRHSNIHHGRGNSGKRAKQALASNISSWFRHHNIASDYFNFVRLLVPSLERERIYSLKEKGLSQLLLSSNALETRSMPRAEQSIRNWLKPATMTAAATFRCANSTTSANGLENCFADAVYNAIKDKPGKPSSMSVAAVNELLTELASLSEFSINEKGVRPTKSNRSASLIIKDLFQHHQPKEVKWLVHIILKSSPFNMHESVTLRSVHPSLWRVYLLRSNLRNACRLVEEGGEVSADIEPDGGGRQRYAGVEVGVMVSLMGLSKATSAKMVVKEMKQRHNEPICFAEVKYDGERMQIHVDATVLNSPPKLQIFSKSKRNSTEDRRLSHDIILQALGLSSQKLPQHTSSTSITTNLIEVKDVIVEAELLVFNELEQKVEPLSAVRNLISNHQPLHQTFPSGLHHFMVVFFDILHLNGANLMYRPLCERRKILEKVIRVSPHHSRLSELKVFDLRNDDATEQLQSYFVEVTNRPAEGLVIKGARAMYIPGCDKFWYKLKKDYIEGYGDTADFAVIGGRFSFSDSAFLGVSRNDDPNLLNVFHVGCQMNRGRDNQPPIFKILFTFSAGFSRQDLLHFCKMVHPYRIQDPQKLSYTVIDPYRTSHAIDGKLEVFFDPPVAVELKGLLLLVLHSEVDL